MMRLAGYAETPVNRVHGVKCQKNLIFEILLKSETSASIRLCACSCDVISGGATAVC